MVLSQSRLGHSPYTQKNNEVGTKATIYGKELWIEYDDAIDIVEGEKVTLMKWGNVTISKKVVDGKNV